MKSLVVTSSLILATFLGTAHAEDSATYVTANALKPDLAERDAARDFQDGKCIIYVIDGRPRSILGADLNEETAKKTYTLIYIEGVGDNFTPEVTKNNKNAADYATAYNKAAVKNCGTKK